MRTHQDVLWVIGQALGCEIQLIAEAAMAVLVDERPHALDKGHGLRQIGVGIQIRDAIPKILHAIGAIFLRHLTQIPNPLADE